MENYTHLAENIIEILKKMPVHGLIYVGNFFMKKRGWIAF